MKLTAFSEFCRLWIAHFGQDVHPIAKSLAIAATGIWRKEYEDTELCWGFFNKQLTTVLALELERGESGEINWSIFLPNGIPTALNLQAWQGRFPPEAPCFASEIASEGNPYCVLEVIFAPENAPGVALEFFLGGKPYNAE